MCDCFVNVDADFGLVRDYILCCVERRCSFVLVSVLGGFIGLLRVEIFVGREGFRI